MLFIEYEERTLAFTQFIIINAVEPGDGAFWLKIRQQGKMQLPVGGKGGVGPYAVDGNAQQFCVVTVKSFNVSLNSAISSPHTGLQSAG